MKSNASSVASAMGRALRKRHCSANEEVKSSQVLSLAEQLLATPSDFTAPESSAQPSKKIKQVFDCGIDMMETRIVDHGLNDDGDGDEVDNGSDDEVENTIIVNGKVNGEPDCIALEVDIIDIDIGGLGSFSVGLSKAVC